MSQPKLYSFLLGLMACLLCATQVLAQADLSLSLVQQPDVPRRYSDYTVTATLTNSGPETATGVTVSLPRPEGVVFVGGREFVASQGRYRPYSSRVWTVGALASGETATLTVSLFLLSPEASLVYAQVLTADQTDPDSTPGNGTAPAPREDDEASTATPVAPACDLVISVSDITCVEKNPSGPRFAGFTAVVTVTSESRNNNGAAVLSTPNVRGPFSTLPVSLGSPTRFEISANEITDGRFTIIAFADGVGCEVSRLVTIPAACPDPSAAGCPFVSGAVIDQGFPQSIEQVGKDYVVTTRTFDDDLQPATDTRYTFDATGVLSSRSATAAQPQGRLELDFVGSAVQLNQRVDGMVETLGVYANPLPATQSAPDVARAFRTDDGIVLVLSYRRDRQQSRPEREDFGYAAITLDDDFQQIGSAVYALNSPFPTEGLLVYPVRGGGFAIVSSGLTAAEAIVVNADATQRVRFEVFERTGRPNFFTDFRELLNGGYSTVYRFEGRTEPIYAEFDADGNRVAFTRFGSRIPDNSEFYTLNVVLLPEGGFATTTITNSVAFAFDPFYSVLVYASDGNLSGIYAYPELERVELFGVDRNGYLLGYASANEGISSAPPGKLVRFDPSGRLSCDRPELNFGADLAVLLPEPPVDPSLRQLYTQEIEVRNQGEFTVTGVTLSGLYLNPEQRLLNFGEQRTAEFATERFSVPPGESRFFTRILANKSEGNRGLYAQVQTMDQPDNDSTPGNGTPPTVNEDDEATNADGAQPDGVDLALSVASASDSPARYANNVTTFTLVNDGSAPATGVSVSVPTPEGVVFTGGSEFVASQGTFSPYGTRTWTVGTLAPGQTATLALSYFRLTAGSYSVYGQVAAANETDVDSSPGNGTGVLPVEDDEANITFAPSQSSSAKLRISPNPVQSGQTLHFVVDLPEAGSTFETDIILSDLLGRVIERRRVTIAPGHNDFTLDTGGIRSGVYFAAMPDIGMRTQRLLIGQ